VPRAKGTIPTEETSSASRSATAQAETIIEKSAPRNPGGGAQTTAAPSPRFETTGSVAATSLVDEGQVRNVATYEQLRDSHGRFLPKEGGELRPGGPFEEMVGDVLQQINDDVVHHIRIQTKSGTVVEVDFASRNTVTGGIRLTEAKGSEKAGFTTNQRAGYPEIKKFGGTVIGTGSREFPSGIRIPPTPVRVVRPSIIERLIRIRQNNGER